MPHYGSIVWETVGRRVEISAKVGATARSTSLVTESERNRKSEKGREEGFNFSQRGVARDYGHLQKDRRRRQRGWKQRNRFFVSQVWPPPPIPYPYLPPPPSPLMPLRRFPSKSNVPRDRESDDARWKTMGVVGKSDRKGGGGVKAGIGNVPKLLYRRSIYGDEKHSLPSTPVAPARVHDSPEASYPASALLMLGTGDVQPLSISVWSQPFHQFADIAR